MRFARILRSNRKGHQVQCACGAVQWVEHWRWEEDGFHRCIHCEHLISFGPGLIVESDSERLERLRRRSLRKLRRGGRFVAHHRFAVPDFDDGEVPF